MCRVKIVRGGRRKILGLAPGFVVMGLSVLAAAVALAGGPDAEEELFWASDSLLAARVDSLGEGPVREQLRATLAKAVDVCRDTSRVAGYDLEGWIAAMRWAVILKDQTSLPILDEIANLEPHPNFAAAHYWITYPARWAAYRIRSADQTDEERYALLMAWFSDADPWRRIFAEDRLAEAGLPCVRAVLDHTIKVILPELKAMDPEPFSAAEAAPLDRYLRFVGLLQQMITTGEERAVLEGLRGSPEPEQRRLAEDVLGPDED